MNSRIFRSSVESSKPEAVIENLQLSLESYERDVDGYLAAYESLVATNTLPLNLALESQAVAEAGQNVKDMIDEIRRKDHKVAMEALSGGMWAAIIAGIAALIALIVKVYKWISGGASAGGGGGGGGGSSAPMNAEEVKIVEKKVEEIKHVGPVPHAVDQTSTAVLKATIDKHIDSANMTPQQKEILRASAHQAADETVAVLHGKALSVNKNHDGLKSGESNGIFAILFHDNYEPKIRELIAEADKVAENLGSVIREGEEFVDHVTELMKRNLTAEATTVPSESLMELKLNYEKRSEQALKTFEPILALAKEIEDIAQKDNSIGHSMASASIGKSFEKWKKLMEDPVHAQHAKERSQVAQQMRDLEHNLDRKHGELQREADKYHDAQRHDVASYIHAMQMPIVYQKRFIQAMMQVDVTVGRYQKRLRHGAKWIADAMTKTVSFVSNLSEADAEQAKKIAAYLTAFYHKPFGSEPLEAVLDGRNHNHGLPSARALMGLA